MRVTRRQLRRIITELTVDHTKKSPEFKAAAERLKAAYRSGDRAERALAIKELQSFGAEGHDEAAWIRFQMTGWG